MEARPGRTSHARREAWLSLAVIAFGLLLSSCSTVPVNRAADVTGGPHEIPFEVVGDHVVLPVQIDGDDEPFKIVLDTGMPGRGLVLYGSPRVDALDLKLSTDRLTVGGAGGAGSNSKPASHRESRSRSAISRSPGHVR